MTIRTGDRQLMKELNIALVMNLIRQQGPTTRVEIAERTGLGRSTVTGIVNRLLREGLILETGSVDAPSGRKPIQLTLNPVARFAVGVKLAPRSATIALVNLNAEVLCTTEIALTPLGGPAAVMTAIHTALTELTAGHNVPLHHVLGVGVVLPGVINPATGTAITSYFLGWENLPIRDLLEQELDLPVYVDNDANGMALAEALYGAGQGMSDLLGITVGVGIGSGLVLNGQIHRGARFNAGELGHVNVLRDGPTCVCGRCGCLEALAADAAIVRRARTELANGKARMLLQLVQGHADLVTRETVVAAAKAGDTDAQAVLAESGEWLGVAISNAINFTSPARVVVGGEAVIDAGELILEPMRRVMRQLVFPDYPESLHVVQSALGRNAWVQGAAALVLTDAFAVPLGEHNQHAMARKVGQAEP